MSRMERIADALVLTMTRGVSLTDWRRLGLLSREWALYERLAPLYGKIVIVSSGSDEDRAVAAGLGRSVEVVCNPRGLEPEAFEADAPDRVLDLVADAGQVIIKTNQMEGGVLAVRIARRLRRAGIRVGLIARGGYLWSRFVAAERGASSSSAVRAGEQEGELCRAADVVVGTSEPMVSDLEWRYGLSRDAVALIPNYVLAEAPVRGADDRESRTILYAGQLVLRKRVDLLIQAVSQLPEPKRSETTLRIVGEGPEEENLKRLADELGVRATFERRVPHGELAERMSRCAVYVQASTLEGHPKTVIEAMATGAPVVVADAPGLEDVVEHCQTGLCTQASADAFAWAIGGLLDDREWREALGSAAASRARLRWGLDTIFMLEVDAHRQAALRSGSNTPTAGGRAEAEVRWEAPLLSAGLEAQVAAWQRSLSGFARRLEARKRAQFLMALDTPVYHLQGESAVEADGGLHPKHRLTGYHGFFTERIRAGERVIDLGCGVGALAASIADRSGAHVTGQDWSEANLERARRAAGERGLSERLAFRVGDITRDRVPGSFDVVVLSNVLEHVNDRPGRLRMWREWYGARRFLIRVPALDRDWRVPWKRELGVEWRLDPTHETEYTRPQLEEELALAGLTPSEVVTRWGEYWLEATVV
jgi:glycosyltransferase involved in cell wall biosynthesis/SAM-dependent methyltransferase